MCDVIPIHAFFDSTGKGPNLNADPHDVLAESEVIYGVEVMSQEEVPVYGRDVLARIAASGVAEAAPVMRIGLDRETEELERPRAGLH